MIDDIDVADTDLRKFVDDTTMAECTKRNEESKIQVVVTELTEKAHAHKFQLNESKCKELRITFTKTDPQFDPILGDEKPLETVSTAKLLGLNISSESYLRNNQKSSAPVVLHETAQKSKYSNERTADFLFYMHSSNTWICLSRFS